jgi:putative nucleotidyltransferase with HDIG domain
VGRLGHLIRRFFGFLRARPPRPGEQALLHEVLSNAEAVLYWDQQYQDQRHALEVAGRVTTATADDSVVLRAALLHDVGKRHSRLGAVSRSLATVLAAADLPMPTRFSAYRAHGALGADELAAIGCEPLVVEFARRHPGPAPEGVDRGLWKALLDADNA